MPELDKGPSFRDFGYSPEAYDARVDGRGKRTALARVLVGVTKEYPPPVGPDGRPQTFLDIAAGTGIISGVLASEGYKVTAFDDDPAFLRSVISKYPDVATQRGDMNKMFPFRRGQFAGATIVWANQYIEDLDKFNAQVFKSLRGNGVFFWPVFRSEQLARFSTTGNRQPSLNDFRASLSNAGFTLEDEHKVSVVQAATKGVELFGRPRILIARKP